MLQVYGCGMSIIFYTSKPDDTCFEMVLRTSNVEADWLIAYEVSRHLLLEKQVVI